MPSITEDLFLSDEDLMITVSADGNNIVGNGGNTGDNNINEGDSRQFNVWSDSEVDEDF
jgi:hypothetical protein